MTRADDAVRAALVKAERAALACDFVGDMPFVAIAAFLRALGVRHIHAVTRSGPNWEQWQCWHWDMLPTEVERAAKEGRS